MCHHNLFHHHREPLSGEPLLPEMPQSGYPRCRLALAVVPDPPHRRPTPESNQTPLLYLGADRSPVLAVGHQPGKISHVVSVSSGHASYYAIKPPWAARRCDSRPRRYSASGPRAEAGPLALNCFPNFLI
jgi:hypothetical protein